MTLLNGKKIIVTRKKLEFNEIVNCVNTFNNYKTSFNKKYADGFEGFHFPFFVFEDVCEMFLKVLNLVERFLNENLELEEVTFEKFEKNRDFCGKSFKILDNTNKALLQKLNDLDYIYVSHDFKEIKIFVKTTTTIIKSLHVEGLINAYFKID